MLGENEIWKDIKGYEGLYQISNRGRIKSLKKWDVNKRGFIDGEKLLAPTDNGNGYLIISLVKDHKRKNHYIHRLVAQAFIDNPNAKEVVNHLDFNKKNNDASNLEWCSFQENVTYSVHRMHRPRVKATTNTGLHYISFIKGISRYRVTVKHKEYGRYENLNEAVKVRDEIIREVMPEWESLFCKK